MKRDEVRIGAARSAVNMCRRWLNFYRGLARDTKDSQEWNRYMHQCKRWKAQLRKAIHWLETELNRPHRQL